MVIPTCRLDTKVFTFLLLLLTGKPFLIFIRLFNLYCFSPRSLFNFKFSFITKDGLLLRSL